MGLVLRLLQNTLVGATLIKCGGLLPQSGLGTGLSYCLGLFLGEYTQQMG